jgi:pentapeptide repeat protein
VLLGLTWVLFLLASLWKIPQWQVGDVRPLDAKERFDGVNEARKTLAQILGGAVLLAGLFGTWQNIKVAQESLAVSQESSQKSLQVSREGQITDRFSKAIEELGAVDARGNKELELRLGGMYALERIANDSERDHWTIMEVLCTYVRLNAPRKPQDSAQKTQTVDPRVQPPADIQAALTILGRRDPTHERADQILYLGNTNLRGAVLPKANLSGTDFTGAYLRWANLTNANLRGAYLAGADLVAAQLGKADLRGAYLFGADLSGAAYLTQEQIDLAVGDSSTHLSPYLHMPESWK